MRKYPDALALMAERFGKDEFWSIATTDGTNQDVRMVDAYYEDGAIYIVTYALSGKMQHIQMNPKVAVCSLWFSGHGIGENLGWVREEKHTARMEKLRVIFAQWYGNGHVNEEDANTILLRIRLTDGVLIDLDKKFGESRFVMDFEKGTAE